MNIDVRQEKLKHFTGTMASKFGLMHGHVPHTTNERNAEKLLSKNITYHPKMIVQPPTNE